MRERSDYIQDFSVPSNSSKCKLCWHFEKPEIECESEAIAFGTSKRFRSFICANRVLTYENSNVSERFKMEGF